MAVGVAFGNPVFGRFHGCFEMHTQHGNLPNVSTTIPQAEKPAAAAKSSAKSATPTSAASPPAAKSASPAETPPAIDAPQPGLSASFWQRSSGFLTSVTVHLVAILLLALFNVAFDEEPTERVLMAAIDSGENDDLDIADLIIEDPLDELEELEALPIQLDDPGLAKFGEVTSAVTAAQVSDVGTMAMSDTLGEIGLLTGGEGDGYASAGDGKGGAAFFGVKAGGIKFVFMVDGSRSMARNGWEFARQELIDAVDRLKPEQRFYVILFADKDYRMFGPKSESPTLMAPTLENKAKLRRWLYNFELVLQTKPLSSVRFAFKLKPDAIYLLTDGQFSDGTESFLKENNRREDAYDGIVPRVVVHTIGFSSTNGQNLLSRIAKDNGGTYRFVPARPKGNQQRRGPGGNMRGR